MEIKNISYARFGELIDEVSDENVKRRRKLEKEIQQLDKSKFFDAKETISWRIALEETVIDEIIEKLKVLKIDIKYYRKSLVNQIKDREQKAEVNIKKRKK